MCGVVRIWVRLVHVGGLCRAGDYGAAGLTEVPRPHHAAAMKPASLDFLREATFVCRGLVELNCRGGRAGVHRNRRDTRK